MTEPRPFNLSARQSGRESDEDVQRAIAERIGITWESYVARCGRGVALKGSPAGEWWPYRWLSVEFAWRPDGTPKPQSLPDPLPAQWAAKDKAHNQAILDAIPKTEPVEPTDALSVAARQHGREGRHVAFFNSFPTEVWGMRGYRPVFDEHDQIVRVGSLFMVEIPHEDWDRRQKRRRSEARAAVESTEPGYVPEGGSVKYAGVDGDVCRLMWRFRPLWLRGVVALYRQPEGYGLEMQTQWLGRPLKLRRLRFYRPQLRMYQ